MRRASTISGSGGSVIRLRPETALSAALTWVDRQALAGWESAGRSAVHCPSDTGPFALLYLDGTRWASFGVARQGHCVLAWDAVTLRDVGRFASMDAALAALACDELEATAPAGATVVWLRCAV